MCFAASSAGRSTNPAALWVSFDFYASSQRWLGSLRPVFSQAKPCQRCGHLARPEANFCSRCGAPVPPGVQSSDSERPFLSRARCSVTKQLFGIRFEQAKHGLWLACETFGMSEQRSVSSVFSSDQVDAAGLAPGYPGCPHAVSSLSASAAVARSRALTKLAMNTSALGARTRQERGIAAIR